MKSISFICLFFFIIQSSLVATFALQDMTEVPDIRGLNVPQATAELNAAGLQLGSQSDIRWTMATSYPANTIGEQSFNPGDSIAAGSVVDISILRVPNITLIYDDNDITLVNQAEDTIILDGLQFVGIDTPTNVRLSAVDMTGRGSIDSGDCGQFWSITDRRSAKDLPECDSIYWRSTRDTNAHFWTQANNIQQFSVFSNDVELARCDAAPTGSQDSPTTCDFYYGTTSDIDFTPYIYIAYTPQTLTIINQSADKWMALDQAKLFSLVSGEIEINLSDTTLYTEIDPVVTLDQLAPGQCVLFTTVDDDELIMPESCNVISKSMISNNNAFWLSNFDIESVTDSIRRTCPVATEDRLTLCIVPQ